MDPLEVPVGCYAHWAEGRLRIASVSLGETCIHPCASGLGGDGGAREICTCQVCDDPDGVNRAVCVFVRSLRVVQGKKC